MLYSYIMIGAVKKGPSRSHSDALIFSALWPQSHISRPVRADSVPVSFISQAIALTFTSSLAPTRAAQRS